MAKREDDYEEVDKDGIINELLERNEKLEGAYNQASTTMHSAGLGNKDPNLAQFQIDNSELLEKLERFYAGWRITYDARGSPKWKQPDNDEEKPFNDFGVSAMMEIVTKYIDRNTTLSYYSDKRIYEILADLGEELTLFILSNYEQMGMDTPFKKTKFRLIVITTIHMIESAYRRALYGKTIDEINQSRIITQSDSIRDYSNQPMSGGKKRGFLSKFLG